MRSKLIGKKTLKPGFFDELEKDQVKEQVNILSLFADFGVELKKNGRGHVGLCPFHDDKNPSLSVDKEKGLYNCFGCGESGDVFDLVQKMRGTDFKEALSYLKTYTGKTQAAAVTKTPEKKVVSKPSPKKTATATPAQVPTVQVPTVQVPLDEVAEEYHKQLYQSTEALRYLEDRGITNKELWGRFKLGYSAGTLEKKLSESQRTALQKQGIYSEKGYEVMTGCITVPLFDEGGKVVGMYGRAVGDSSLNHRYLAGGHRGVFNGRSASVYRDELIVTESIFDALSLLQLGFENVIPMYGTNGLTEMHVELFQNERVQQVVLAFDADEAGQKAVRKHTAALIEKRIQVKTIVPPAGKDWNEYLMKGGTKEDIQTLCSTVTATEPKKPEDSLQAEKKGLEYIFRLGEVVYRLLGVKEGFVSSLKVNISVETGGKRFPDNCDLYSARSRASFASLLSSRMDIPEAKVEEDLLQILAYLEKKRDQALSLEKEGPVELTEEEKKIGMEFLTSPDLFDQIISDTEVLGYVGDEVNKLLVYLAASSRKLDDPISVMVISESAAGKSFLAETIVRLIPEEDVLSTTSMSDQALNYLEEEDLLHKFMVMGEAVHNEVIEHQIREMLSAKELSRLVTTKDQKTGTMTSKLVRKKALVSAVMSSTNYEVNPENASRFFVVNTNESEDQTAAIHARQRLKYSLNRMKQKEETIPSIIHKHKCAQRLLVKRRIVNPFAPHLDFPSKLMRSRRDHERFIDLIAVVCFVRQFQKNEKTSESFTYIECDLEDYKIAYEIMTHILPSTMTSFPKAAITLYEQINRYVKEKAAASQIEVTDVSFTQREVREYTELNQRFIKRYMSVLAEYEYIKTGGLKVRGSRNYYSLVTEGELNVIDLSSIPTPEAMQEKLQNV